MIKRQVRLEARAYTPKVRDEGQATATKARVCAPRNEGQVKAVRTRAHALRARD